MTPFNKILSFAFLLTSSLSFSQGGASSCEQLQANFEEYQACATTIEFQNSINNPSGENFNTTCIGEPFHGPTWFFLEIQNSGNILLQISQVNNAGGGTDVDFVLWGPFGNLNNICDQLSINKEADCSWDGSSIENVTLNNAVSGEFYILLIDNYSNVPGQITITQTGGTGSSSCDFLSSVEIKDTSNNEITALNYCIPATKDIMAVVDVSDFPGNVADLRFNYKWYKDDVLIAAIDNSLSSSNVLNTTESGIYKVEMSAYDSTDPDVDLNNLTISNDEIELFFFETPVLNSTPIGLQQCDFITPNNDGIAITNLTEVSNTITNGENGITLSYYTDAALTQLIADPANFTNTTAFNQTIYVTGIKSDQAFACVSNTATIELTIDPTSVASYPDIAPLCPVLNTESTTIDFDAQRELIKNTFFPAIDAEISFYANPSDASTEQNEITNATLLPIGTAIIYTRVETDNNCSGIGTFQIEVYDTPDQNTILPLIVCENETVLLANKDSEILTGQDSSVQASYFTSFEDARDNLNAINKNTALNLTVGTSTIFVRLFDNNTQCFSIVSFSLNVFAVPVITTPGPLSTCGNTTAEFNLSLKISEITANNPNFQVDFYETQADMNADNPITNPNGYTSVSKTIFVKVTDTAGNDCFATTSLVLNVLETPGTTENPALQEFCDASGFYTFDLTVRESLLAGTTPSSQIAFKYYINLNDAEANNNNTIGSPEAFTNTIIDYQKIYIRLNSTINFDSESGIACYRIYEQELFVRPYPENLLKSTSYKICVDIDGNVVSDAIIDAGLPETDYDFIWYNGFDAIAANQIINGNGRIFTTPVAGEYSVKITNITNSALCATVVNFTAENTLVPFSITGEPTELVAFGIDNTITAIATPQSDDFEYMLDSLGWQENNVFYNIEEGIYTLTVRNKFGCGEVSTTIVVTDYPKFFTPNGDGHNDFWNIGGRIGVDVLNVYIFDRYGKLLKDISRNESGWDGTYEGRQLPSDDYWFKATYSKNGVRAEYINHFTLKR